MEFTRDQDDEINNFSEDYDNVPVKKVVEP